MPPDASARGEVDSSEEPSSNGCSVDGGVGSPGGGVTAERRAFAEAVGTAVSMGGSASAFAVGAETGRASAAACGSAGGAARAPLRQPGHQAQ